MDANELLFAGGAGFIVTVSVNIFLRWFNVKTLVVGGLIVGLIAVIPMGIITPTSNFWAVRPRPSSVLSSLAAYL